MICIDNKRIIYLYKLLSFCLTMDCNSVRSSSVIPKCSITVYVTTATETCPSAQNDISQEEVFNVQSSHFHVLLGGFHWKLWSIFFIRLRIEIECLRFFCNFFCGVISWLWFINMVLFHVQSWNKWTELFNLDGDKIHTTGWKSGWYW